MTEESISGSGSTESGQRVRGRRDGTGRMGSRGQTEIGTSAKAGSPGLQDGLGAESRGDAADSPALQGLRAGIGAA